MLVFSTPLVYCCLSTFSLTSSPSQSKFNTLFLTRFKTYKLLHHPNKNDHKRRHLGIGVFKFLRPWRQCTDRDKLGDWERRMFTLGRRHTDRLTDRLAKTVRNTGTRNFSLNSKGYYVLFCYSNNSLIHFRSLICRHRSMSYQAKEMFKIFLLIDCTAKTLTANSKQIFQEIFLGIHLSNLVWVWTWGFWPFLVESFVYFSPCIFPQSFSQIQTTTGGGRRLPCNEKPIYVFPENKKLRGLSIYFLFHVSVIDLHIYFHNRSTYFPAAEQADRSWEYTYKSLTDTWMWKLGLRPHNSFSGNIFSNFP